MTNPIVFLCLLSCLTKAVVSQFPYPYPDPIKVPQYTCLPLGSPCNDYIGSPDCCPGTYCSTSGIGIKYPLYGSTCRSGVTPLPPIPPYPYKGPQPFLILRNENGQ